MRKIKKIVRSINFFRDHVDAIVEICKDERISFTGYVNKVIENDLNKRGYVRK